MPSSRPRVSNVCCVALELSKKLEYLRSRPQRRQDDVHKIRQAK